MLWVTRPEPRVDGVASAWLIRRFVDREATFAFDDDLDAILARNATPFDLPGVALGRRDERCAFESILLKYELDDPALEELAALVHEAELDDGTYPVAEAPGLDAVLHGLRLTNAGAEAYLAAAMPVLDGMYAWFRHLDA